MRSHDSVRKMQALREGLFFLTWQMVKRWGISFHLFFHSQELFWLLRCSSVSPSIFQKKVWWNALTALCIAVLGGLLVGGMWLVGEVLAYLQPVLVPLAVAGILAYLLEPIVNWIEEMGVNRIKAILVVFVIGIVSFGGFSAMIAAPFASQVKKLNSNKEVYLEKAKKMFSEVGKFDGLDGLLPARVKNLISPGESPALSQGDQSAEPDLTRGASQQVLSEGAGVSLDVEKQPLNWGGFLSFSSLMESLQESAPNLAKRVLEVVTRGASKFFGIIGYALGFIMVPIYLFFFLKESVVIQKNWRRFVPLRASSFKDEVVDVVAEINGYLIAFFRGQVIVSLIDGFLVGLILKFFGHPYAILIGIALAAFGVIPFIGNIICLIPAAVTAYAHFSLESEQYWLGENPWVYVIVIVSIFIVVQQINSLVTAPKIVGDSVGLHPMTVIFSMLFWSLLLGGFLGALLAVPLTASVKVLFKRYIWQKQVMLDPEPEAV